MSQSNSSFNALSWNFPAPKKMEEVTATTWKIGTKGMRTLTLSFNEKDTILYKISRARLRKATFYLLDSSSVPVTKEFGEANIIPGGFVVGGQGTYLFKIKNRSFLNNSFTLEVKKVPYLPPPPPPPKEEEKPKPDSVIVVTVDSIVTLVDSMVYLASTLNFNQPSAFIIPYNVEKKYDCYIVKSKEVTLKTIQVNGDKKSTAGVVLDCNKKIFPSNDIEGVIVYLSQPDERWELTDSLAIRYIEKDKKYCHTTITGSKSNSKNMVVSNDEKVPGKHIHIQVKEIVKSPKKRPKTIIEKDGK